LKAEEKRTEAEKGSMNQTFATNLLTEKSKLVAKEGDFWSIDLQEGGCIEIFLISEAERQNDSHELEGKS
jgi:hypothetical protein